MQSRESLILTKYFSQYHFVLFSQDTYAKWSDVLHFKNKRTTYLFTKTTSDHKNASVSVVTHKGMITEVHYNQPCGDKKIFKHLINLPVSILENFEKLPEVLKLVHEHLSFFDYEKQRKQYDAKQMTLFYTKIEEGHLVVGCDVTFSLHDKIHCYIQPRCEFPENTSSNMHNTDVVGNYITGLVWEECQEVSYVLHKNFPELDVELKQMEVFR